MDPDFDIELQSGEPRQARLRLPLHYRTQGTVRKGDTIVYIHQEVYTALEKMAASDTTQELGSILIGNYRQKNGTIHVVISGYIEAKYAEASAATLTFTHQTWDYVHGERERLYPEKKIIGWQHTHPNYGVFLSSYDLFIQENFFNLPFQVAYVIDPVRKRRGFFQWKDGQIEPLKGFHIYDRFGKTIQV